MNKKEKASDPNIHIDDFLALMGKYPNELLQNPVTVLFDFAYPEHEIIADLSRLSALKKVIQDARIIHNPMQRITIDSKEYATFGSKAWDSDKWTTNAYGGINLQDVDCYESFDFQRENRSSMSFGGYAVIHPDLCSDGSGQEWDIKLHRSRRPFGYLSSTPSGRRTYGIDERYKHLFDFDVTAVKAYH